ncbi:MAG: carbon starvation protein A [Candidatus Eisenbacteria sp.]|nr:carbon starvation protein A [Candidatus Eisenbacteria bacterium]
MLAGIFIGGTVLLLTGFFFYARKLERILGVTGERETPAVTEYDGVDYVPARAPILFGHHFASIAGAGPIVGPVIAGLAFGWLPALAWIILGTVLIGGMHDYTTLIASIRHRGRSIGEVARAVISPGAQKILLGFIWLTLIYVLVVFLDLTATTFTADGGVATSSMIFIALAVLFGLAIYRLRLSIPIASLIFVPLIFLAVYVGQQAPFDPGLLPRLGDSVHLADPTKTWIVILVLYCYLASVMPVWMLLQPRDYLSSYLLYATVLLSAVGLLLGGFAVTYPAFIAFNTPAGPLFPILFVTIACGAVSGFHSVISSGTTAKQLGKEREAKTIGFGAMTAEGIVALIALATVILLASDGAIAAGYRAHEVSAIGVFTAGMGRFAAVVGIPPELGAKFGGLAISTFLLTTLDTCTRLGRFLLHEFFGIRKVSARYLSSLITIALPALFVLLPFKDAQGNPVPAWKAVWPLFGTANQLLAGLGLLIVSVWLRRQGQRAWWALIPMVFMFAITFTSLASLILGGTQSRLIELIAVALFVLALVVIALGLRVMGRRLAPEPPLGSAATAAVRTEGS